MTLKITIINYTHSNDYITIFIILKSSWTGGMPILVMTENTCNPYRSQEDDVCLSSLRGIMKYSLSHFTPVMT